MSDDSDDIPAEIDFSKGTRGKFVRTDLLVTTPWAPSPGPVPTADEAAGMSWWNEQTDRARAIWLQRAGSAVAADAWALLKSDPGVAFGVGVQEAQELAEGFGECVSVDQVVRKLAKHLTLDDVLVFKGDDGRLYTERIRDVRQTAAGTLLVRSGPIGHRSRSCLPGEFVDVVRS